MVVTVLLLAGCMDGGGYAPAAYPAYQPAFQFQNTVPQSLPRMGGEFTSSQTWCRPDGAGGMWCG